MWPFSARSWLRESLINHMIKDVISHTTNGHRQILTMVDGRPKMIIH